MLMSHLNEIADLGARNGVYTFQTRMEIILLSFLDHDRTVALAQVEAARVVAALDYIEDLGAAARSASQHALAERLATAMLTSTFERLRIVLEAPNGNGSSFRAS